MSAPLSAFPFYVFIKWLWLCLSLTFSIDSLPSPLLVGSFTYTYTYTNTHSYTHTYHDRRGSGPGWWSPSKELPPRQRTALAFRVRRDEWERNGLSARRRRGDPDPSYDYEDRYDSFEEVAKGGSRGRGVLRDEDWDDDEYQDYENYSEDDRFDDEEDYDDDDDYYDDDFEDEYDYDETTTEDEDEDVDDFDDDVDDEDGPGDGYEWELFDGHTDILLPPPGTVPDVVVHFVGGTFVGSLPPRVAYRSLLEGLARSYRQRQPQRQRHMAVVASRVPLASTSTTSNGRSSRLSRSLWSSLPTQLSAVAKSPLDHRTKASIIRRNLRRTWAHVLEDEYGDAMSRAVVVGVGHSLGARLQVLVHCRPPRRPTTDKTLNDKLYDKLELDVDVDAVHRVRANVLVSFNNWNAARSIPLLEEVDRAWRASTGLGRKLIRWIAGGSAGEGQRRRRRDDWTPLPQRRRSNDRPNPRNRREYDRDRDRPRRRSRSRSRSSKSDSDNNVNDNNNRLFEFDPSPATLWNIIDRSSPTLPSGPNAVCYTVPKNLLVQFDDDDLDQSSEFATRFVNVDKVEGTIDLAAPCNVKFARLKGNHLTPCTSPMDYENDNKDPPPYDDNDDDISKQVSSTNVSKTRRMQEMNDFISTIVTYIDHIVAEEHNVHADTHENASTNPNMNANTNGMAENDNDNDIPTDSNIPRENIKES